MGLFNIDIERFYQEHSSDGGQVMGMFCIQYPIYCIHANILDNTPDPLDNLDKIITDFFRIKTNFTSFQIASLIGTSKSLVELRISSLIQDKLLEKTGENCSLTDLGNLVFFEKTKVRQHKRTYDFYLDGLTLEPLPEVFYGHYRYKFISEHDSFFKTWKGKPTIVRPFGPDLVHTPPDQKTIREKILSVEYDTRSAYEIPLGLEIIEDLTYTKLSLQLLIAVTKKNGKISKELIDPFVVYSISDTRTYLDALRENIKRFGPSVESKISNLEFRLVVPKSKDENKEPIPVLGSNWPEIDKYQNSKDVCFNFTKEDLNRAVRSIYELSELDDDCLVNSENELEIKIDKKILLSSTNRHKLINDLIRRRDYKFGNVDHNVFLLYIHYSTEDPYVKEIIQFKELVQLGRETGIKNALWILSKLDQFSLDFRELCVSAGELEVLEEIDMDLYMVKLV